ncbi:MAG: 2OG-Fe(II) oxygenase [Caulobacterales bacterium]|nr:2OG-Fe(II) oxygenase [Caulobacterales bacterium]
MPLNPGQPAPWFTAPTPSNREFVFDSAAGRYVLLLFLPVEASARHAALTALAAHQRLFDDDHASAFVVIRDPAAAEGLRDLRGLRWVMDFKGSITDRYGPEPHWLLLDPTLRVMATAPAEAPEPLLQAIAQLPPPAAHAGVAMHAPILIAPRIFEPELCEALIALHQADGGRFTGVMRDAGVETVHVMDELKKRRDVAVRDPELLAAIRERLERRLFPLIKLALGFTVTEIERHLVSCYAADDGGVFHPHRDNTTQGTAHRRFACSLNLNDGFEGGDLRFPEFGLDTYRPPLGGAVVFACGLMHEARPIRSGVRYAFLPFFYDAAGAAILAAYQDRVAKAQGVSA